jgi:hypothetical protein
MPEPAPSCRSCRFWLKNDMVPGGVCELAMDNFAKSTGPIHAEGSSFFASDKGRRSYLHTGPDFACVHHQRDPHA